MPRHLKCKYPGCTTSADDMKKHFEAKHSTSTGNWKCPIEGCTTMSTRAVKELTIANLKRHLDTRHPKWRDDFPEYPEAKPMPSQFQCHILGCSKTFISTVYITRHVEGNHPSCPVCEMVLLDMEKLLDHMKSTHPIEHKTQVFDIGPMFYSVLVPIERALVLAEALPMAKAMLAAEESEDSDHDDIEEYIGDDIEEIAADMGYSDLIMACVRIRNQDVLDRYAEVRQGFKLSDATLERYRNLEMDAIACPGESEFQCPFGVTLSMSTSSIVTTRHGHSDFALQLQIRCYFCAYRAVRRYKEEYAPKRKEMLLKRTDGGRYCEKGGTDCEPVEPGYIHCQEHRYIQSKQAFVSNLKLLLKIPRIGTGNDIETPEQFATHLEKYGIPEDPTHASTIARRNIRLSASTFFLDIEFVGPTPIEISVLDAHGNVILDTVVNHNCTILALYQNVKNPLGYATLGRIYGPPTTSITPGMTYMEIMQCLRDHGLDRDSFLVEWSTSFCDSRRLRRIAQEVDMLDTVPPEGHCIRLVNVFKKAFPGFVSWKLGVAFHFLCTNRHGGAPHRAGYDTYMLYEVTQVYIKYSFEKNGKKRKKRKVEELD